MKFETGKKNETTIFQAGKCAYHTFIFFTHSRLDILISVIMLIKKTCSDISKKIWGKKKIDKWKKSLRKARRGRKVSRGIRSIAKTHFSHVSFENLSDKERLKLSGTAQDLISFLNRFSMLQKVKSITRLCLAKYHVQNTERDYCSVFQLCFYDHFLGPNNDSKILNHENILKIDGQSLLNELFLFIKLITKVFKRIYKRK